MHTKYAVKPGNVDIESYKRYRIDEIVPDDPRIPRKSSSWALGGTLRHEGKFGSVIDRL